RARILVVDDEKRIRELISTILQLDGHETLEAGNGEEALALIEADLEHLPELILLDISMPRMDGWRFLELLYRRGLRRKTRVVIVTGTFDLDQPDGTGAATSILPKPFDADALTKIVSEALARGPDELFDTKQRSTDLARLLADV